MKSTRSPRRSAASAAPAPVGVRNVLLASIGATILVRRRASVAAEVLSTVPDRARAGIDAAGKALRSEIKRVEREAKEVLAPASAKVGRIVEEATAYGNQARGFVATRVNPMLAKAGLPAIPAPAKAEGKRKSAGKAPARKVARPAARRAVRKSA